VSGAAVEERRFSAASSFSNGNGLYALRGGGR